MSEQQPGQNNFGQDQVDESELSPEARAVIVRARRSMAISMSILLLGFVAVVGALVYRTMQSGGSPELSEELTQIALPAGAELLSASRSGNTLLISYSLDGQQSIAWVSTETGETFGTTEIVSE